jgi:hypothetical protein
MFDTIYELTN